LSKILVIGDFILDRYIYGEMTRFSPEAPVPIFNQKQVKLVAGGAGNVLANLAALGADYRGMLVLSLTWNLPDECQDTLPPKVTYWLSPDYDNTVKTRLVANHQQVIRIDEDNKKFLSPKYEDTLLKQMTYNFSKLGCEYLIISDYNKGLISEEFAMELVALANEFSVKVIVDTKKKNISCYSGAYLITPNEKEFNSFTHKVNIDHWLITRGKEGMRWEYPIPEEPYIDAQHFTAYDVIRPDVSGAGDTVIATLAWALSEGKSMFEAIRLAKLAASIVVNKEGTSVCTKEELDAEIKKGKYKLYSLEEMKNQIDSWKQQGLTVGVINGCFDLLHAGHIHLIKEAKKHCDKLMILLNSNSSVTKLKGSDRPYNTTREMNLAAIPSVDAVLTFDSLTPAFELQYLMPDIHFTGTEYSMAEVRKVSSVGIIKQIPHLDNNLSTTRTIT
jgi:D-beta-D-heptose 7-phosphate kinase/D-beta-D-heptose 1-phosphate adenosyltransferase